MPVSLAAAGRGILGWAHGSPLTQLRRSRKPETSSLAPAARFCQRREARGDRVGVDSRSGQGGGPCSARSPRRPKRQRRERVVWAFSMPVRVVGCWYLARSWRWRLHRRVRLLRWRIRLKGGHRGGRVHSQRRSSPRYHYFYTHGVSYTDTKKDHRETGGRNKMTALCGGSLGSWVDEERSKLRDVVQNAGHTNTEHRHLERTLRPGLLGAWATSVRVSA